MKTNTVYSLTSLRPYKPHFSGSFQVEPEKRAAARVYFTTSTRHQIAARKFEIPRDQPETCWKFGKRSSCRFEWRRNTEHDKKCL